MAQKNPCESWREDKEGSQEEANEYCKDKKGLVYCGSKEEAATTAGDGYCMSFEDFAKLDTNTPGRELRPGEGDSIYYEFVNDLKGYSPEEILHMIGKRLQALPKAEPTAGKFEASSDAEKRERRVLKLVQTKYSKLLERKKARGGARKSKKARRASRKHRRRGEHTPLRRRRTRRRQRLRRKRRGKRTRRKRHRAKGPRSPTSVSVFPDKSPQLAKGELVRLNKFTTKNVMAAASGAQFWNTVVDGHLAYRRASRGGEPSRAPKSIKGPRVERLTKSNYKKLKKGSKVFYDRGSVLFRGPFTFVRETRGPILEFTVKDAGYSDVYKFSIRASNLSEQPLYFLTGK